jgi:tetratricopeptide (TPR) repeat protein
MRALSLKLLAVAALVTLDAASAASLAYSAADTVREAYALVQNKRAPEAAEKLAPLVPQYGGDADFNTVYGMALLESGRPAEAAAALRRALAVRPDHTTARVQLGRALTAADALGDARREFALLRDRKDVPANVRRVMDQNVATIDGERQRRAEAERQRQIAAAYPPIGPQPDAGEAAIMRAAAELIRARRAREAAAELAPLAPRLGGNPDFDHLYGLALLDSGRPGEGSAWLRRAVETRPNAHAARAEWARALVAMGDFKAARREFALLRDTEALPSIIRDAMGRQITAIDSLIAARARPRLSGYVEGAGGYDTNVNGGPSGTTLLVPALAFLGPATIAPQARAKESAFAELSAGLALTNPLGEDTAVFANLTGTGRALARHHDFQTAVGGGEIGIAHRFGGFGTVSLAAVGQTFGIDEDFYRHLWGAAAVWRNRFVDVWDVSLAGSWLRLDYPDRGHLDADRYTATAAVARRFDLALAPVVALAVNGGREETRDGAWDFFSFDFVGARANLELTLWPGLVAFGQASYEARDYGAEFPLFERHRADDLVEFVGGFEIKVMENLLLRPSARWSRTWSNVDLYDMDRTTGSLALRWQF